MPLSGLALARLTWTWGYRGTPSRATRYAPKHFAETPEKILQHSLNCDGPYDIFIHVNSFTKQAEYCSDLFIQETSFTKMSHLFHHFYAPCQWGSLPDSNPRKVIIILYYNAIAIWSRSVENPGRRSRTNKKTNGQQTQIIVRWNFMKLHSQKCHI